MSRRAPVVPEVRVRVWRAGEGKLSTVMKLGGRAWGMGWLAIAMGSLAFLASLGYGGIAWIYSSADVLRPFRLHAAPRTGHVIFEPVQLMARPRLVLESAAIHPAEPIAEDDGPGAIARSRRLVLDRPVISVEVGASGTLSGPAVMAALDPVVARLASLDIQSLTIRGGTIKLLSDTSEPDVLSDVDVQITPQRRASATISGQLTYLGQRLKLAATVMRPAASTAEYRWPIQATISGGLFEARFDGAIAEEKGLRLNGAVDFSVPRLREIALWIGIGSPRAGNLEAMRLRGALDWTGGAMAFSKATLTLDGNEGVGAVSVTRTGRRTAVEGTLAFKQLDLKPYIVSTMVERTLLAPIVAVTRPPAIASLLESVDADLRISCDTLVIPGVETGQAAVAITLKNGKLLADVAELAIEEGVFKGQLAVERIGPDPRYGLTGKLEGVEAGRLLQRSLGRNPLQGRADISMNLTTTGDTADELLTSLGGKARIDMRQGGRLGLDLRTLVQSAKRADLRGWQTASASITGLDELALQLDVQRGVIYTTILQARSGSSTFAGGGSIDLPGRTLDFTLTLGTLDPAARPGVGETLVLSGPWQAPGVRIERRDEAAHRPPEVHTPALPMNRK